MTSTPRTGGLSGDGIHPRDDAEREAGGAAVGREGGSCAGGATGGSSGGGACRGGSASRREAGEPASDRRRTAEGTGLRVGKAAASGGAECRDGEYWPDAGDDRDSAVHGAGAVARRGGGRSDGYSFGGGGAVGNGDGTAAVRQIGARTADHGDPTASAGAARAAQPAGAGGAGAAPRQGPGEGPGKPLPVREGTGCGSAAAGHAEFGHGFLEGGREAAVKITEEGPAGADGSVGGSGVATRAERRERMARAAVGKGGWSCNSLAGGVAAGEPLRRSGAGVLCRRHDRGTDHRPVENRVTEGDIADLGDAVQRR